MNTQEQFFCIRSTFTYETYIVAYILVMISYLAYFLQILLGMKSLEICFCLGVNLGYCGNQK